MKFSEKYKNTIKYCNFCEHNSVGIQDKDDECEKYNNVCFNCVEICSMIAKESLNKKLKKIKK